jgi:hypothetical protein
VAAIVAVQGTSKKKKKKKKKTVGAPADFDLSSVQEVANDDSKDVIDEFKFNQQELQNKDLDDLEMKIMDENPRTEETE